MLLTTAGWRGGGELVTRGASSGERIIDWLDGIQGESNPATEGTENADLFSPTTFTVNFR